jgi:hypothetical protein
MLETFILQPEHILLPFFKAFFSQEYLYGGIRNAFKYVDNVSDNTLIINISDDYGTETPNALPSLVIQEGGFSEDRRILGAGRKLWSMSEHNELYKSSFMHPLTIHCVTEEKGSAKFLQASLAKAIITFRWALYEYGINDISPLQGFPPSRLDGDTTAYMYDCPITFQVQMDANWSLFREGDTGEKILIAFTSLLDNISYSDTGEIVSENGTFEDQVIAE